MKSSDIGALLVCLATSLPANAAAPLSAQEAGKHIGEIRTVCGEVASAKYAARSRRQPTFFDLERPYPNQAFAIIIWGADRAKFEMPEVRLLGKQVCATGPIEIYRGKPEIIVADPAQLVAQ